MFTSIKCNPVGMKMMLGSDFVPKKENYIGKIGRDTSSFLSHNS